MTKETLVEDNAASDGDMCVMKKGVESGEGGEKSVSVAPVSSSTPAQRDAVDTAHG